MKSTLARKVMTGAISSTIYPFALLLTFIFINGKAFFFRSDDWLDIASGIPVIMLYSAPAIFLYGIPASMISDKISDFIVKFVHAERAKQITATTMSALLHMLFGLILSWYSIVAAILFFITDLVIRQSSKLVTWKHAILSLSIPLALWVLLIGIVWIKHWFS